MDNSRLPVECSPYKLVGLLINRQKKFPISAYREFLSRGGDPCALVASSSRSSLVDESLRLAASREEREQAAADLLRWQKEGISTLALGEPLYPHQLASMYDPPPLLFYLGQLPNDFHSRPFLSVVGSRRADTQGCDIGFRFSQDLAKAGITIVSGLAMGIDAMAHWGALGSGLSLPTVAILGNGLPLIYPTINHGLAEKILESGGVIMSQFEPGEKPFPSNFLNRNRIIASLSRGVLVVQATERSGSLVTARFALEEGRDVFIIPGSITDSRYAGSNNLIKQGASLVSSVDDILEFFPEFETPHRPAEKVMRLELSPLERQLLMILVRQGEADYDDLSVEGVSESEKAQALLSLEMKGAILRLPGNRIAKSIE